MNNTEPFSLLIKPTSADCNLRCHYCFYLEKAALYPDTRRHRMSAAVLEQTIKSYMATQQPVYAFNWQGGEPTLMGADFFQHVTRLQSQYGRDGVLVSNGLQTNATLIDQSLARHLAQYRFLVGCSLDGPPELHDWYRVAASGRPSHAEVMRGVQMLRRHGVAINVLVLVHQANVGHTREVYHYLLEQGFAYQQYIPCVEADGEGRPQPFAVSGSQWGDFLCELFDQWYPADAGRVSIRHIDALLTVMTGDQPPLCTLGDNCCRYFVVEYNGDIYPCDFFVERPLRLGNVSCTSWQAALDSPVYRQFGQQKAQWNDACQTCRHLSLCHGDCLKHRMLGGSGPETLSWLCEGWKQFLDHARPRLQLLARNLARQQSTAHRRRASAGTAASRRNAPCPCGSGRKFKRCCGRGRR